MKRIIDKLTIALPKGRIAEETLDKFEKLLVKNLFLKTEKLILEKLDLDF